MLTIDEVEEKLNNKKIKIFEVVFLKKDGTERQMFFTINNELIQELGIVYKATKNRINNPEVVNVVELVKNGDEWQDAQYRSFRKDNVIKLEKAII